MLTIRSRRVLMLAVMAGVAVVALAATAADAGAGAEPGPGRGAPYRGARPTPPALVLDGAGTYTISDDGTVVVEGRGELGQRHAPRGAEVPLTAHLTAEGGTLPGPDECRAATATVAIVDRQGGAVTLVGSGQVCGWRLQPPVSVVSHGFNGSYEVRDGRASLVGSHGFFEVRLGADGSAHLFAIAT